MKNDIEGSLDNADYFVNRARRAVEEISQTLDDLKELDLSSLSKDEKQTIDSLLRLSGNAAVTISDINTLLLDQVKEIQKREGKK